MRSTILELLSFVALLFSAQAVARDSQNELLFLLRQTELVIRQVDFSEAKYFDQSGYPKLDPAKLDRERPRVVERTHTALLLENRYLRVTLLPELGRVYSLFSKITSHEQLWINPIAKPITGQQNDTGWWMVWGGVEYTIPRGEHGTTWALPWSYRIIEDSQRRKAVQMTVLEPKTKLQEQLVISVYPDRALYEAEITITNTSDRQAPFSHWINPMWAPGGRGQITPETEFIVPCSAMRVADKDFNRWMLGERIQEFECNPLRWIKHWRSIGDLLCDRLTAGFYSAFSHEENEGVVRVFDPKLTPGVDIWTWGYPPPPERQREYSLLPNLGYVEMWGGTARDFTDEARHNLAPRMEVHWKEWMYPYHGTEGLTFANRDAAVNFKYDPRMSRIDLGLFVVRPIPRATVLIQTGVEVLFRRRMDLSPQSPIRETISFKGDAKRSLTSPKLILKQGSRTILNTEAKEAVALRWGGPYPPAEN